MNTHTGCLLSLNAFQIKIIALITMTIDHIGAYQTFTSSQTVNDGLRIAGRIAAPLFLFMVTEGMRHTHNKPGYIFRLYAAGVIIELLNRMIELYTRQPGPGNTLPAFFYTALFIYCIERMIQQKQIQNNRSRVRTVLICSFGLLLPFLSYVLHVILSEHGFHNVWAVISVFFPSPMNVDYSILFVLMGIAWYFIHNSVINSIILALLSLICMLVPGSVFFTTQSVWFAPVFFGVYQLFINTQWCMFLAAPFMLLYNGQKGRSLKYLFYIYYPLHVYILFFVQFFRNI